MNYDTLYTDFKKTIPEGIEFCKEKEIENLIDDTVGMHVAFGMVIVPYILHIAENNDEKIIQKIFDFLEQMAVCQDVKVQEVLDFTILEQLAEKEYDIFQECKKYMGLNTLEHWEQIV